MATSGSSQMEPESHTLPSLTLERDHVDTVLPYPLHGTVKVSSIPFGTKTMPVYKMTIDDIRNPHTVFDNLVALRKLGDPPFFMGILSGDDLTHVNYNEAAKLFEKSSHIQCNYNMFHFKPLIEKMKKKKPVTKRKGAKKQKIDCDDEQDAILLPTAASSKSRHQLTSPHNPNRHRSLYLMSEICEGYERTAMKILKLDKYLHVGGVLPLLYPQWKCISSVGYLMSEPGHLLGYHRENNLFCSVNLLFIGRKKWTFLDPDANENFQVLSQKLVSTSSLNTLLEHCTDPSQHKEFGILFNDNNISITRYTVEQLPGQVIFVPSNVFHQVEVIEPSVAIAFNSLDAEWTRQDVEKFHKHCDKHDDLKGFGDLGKLRAAYSVLTDYALGVKKCFLEKKELHPHPALSKYMMDEMNTLAIHSDIFENRNCEEQGEDEDEEEGSGLGSNPSVRTDHVTPHDNVTATSLEKIQSGPSELHSSEPSMELGPLVPLDTQHDHVSEKMDSARNLDADIVHYDKSKGIESSSARNLDADIVHYDKSKGVESSSAMVMMEVQAKHKCLTCGRFFVASKDARLHCNTENFCCRYCQRLCISTVNRLRHEETCDKNPIILAAKEEEKTKEEEVMRLRFKDGIIPPENERDKALVKCVYCKKYFTFGKHACGIKQHEKYCTKNENAFVRATRGTALGVRGPKVLRRDKKIIQVNTADETHPTEMVNDDGGESELSENDYQGENDGAGDMDDSVSNDAPSVNKENLVEENEMFDDEKE